MNSFGNSSFLGKELGPITVGQIFAMLIASIAGIALLFWKSAGMIIPLCLVVAIIVYMLPHLFGAAPKVKVVFLLIFLVGATLVGTFSVGPSCIEDNSSQTVSEHNGIAYEITYSENKFTFTITDTSGNTQPTVIGYTELSYIAFKNIYLKEVNLADVNFDPYDPLNPLVLDSNKIYNVFVAHLDSEGNIDSNTVSYSTLTGFNYDGNYSKYTLTGSVYVAAYIALFFFIILGITTIMRNRLKHTRSKMEAAGRLYPQGYGRCNFCGAIVLPGEVNCRKCGAYIDRPDSMKPRKKEYLACSVCGTEITEEMTECPKCGAKFEGEESVVIHQDGTKDSTTEMMICPVCGKHIPSTSERCVYCGKKFNE